MTYDDVRLYCLSVSQCRRHVYADIQPHLYDAVDWTLERLSAVPHSNAPRLSVQHVGRH